MTGKSVTFIAARFLQALSAELAKSDCAVGEFSELDTTNISRVAAYCRESLLTDTAAITAVLIDSSGSELD